MELKDMDLELQPEEMELNGFWIDLGSSVVKDSNWERIELLTAELLEELASAGGDTLYRDPDDGRLWEKSYPASHIAGGGPPRLAVILPGAAREKYGI